MKITVLSLLFVLFVTDLQASDNDFESRLKIAELSGNRELVESICKEWYASGQYSPGLLNWNYNALMSVEQHALYFTQQESDTYPALLLQYALGIRPDVRVLSLQLLEDQQYRDNLIASEQLTWVPQKVSLPVFFTQLLNPSQQGRPVYLGCMIDKNRLQADREKLYLTGLALKFTAKPFDNLAALRNNFETTFRTDYLELALQPEKDAELVAKINLNYLPAFLLLYRHYSNAGDQVKAGRIERLALSVARAGGKEDEVLPYFKLEKAPNPVSSSISVKSLDKKMKPVRSRLFAAESELSNAEYEAFLFDLIKNKDFEKINRCQLRKTDWIALLPDSLKHLTPAQLFPNGHPDDPNFPVQNITHEAATLYCQWITAVYNNSPEKRKFRKVIFRLPTMEEWETAARAGRPDVPYAWGGYFVRNSKGCYLGNFNVSSQPCDNCSGKNDASNDGGVFPVATGTYFPNDFGLYNISGNVAEMLDDPTKIKGGSWKDIPYYGQIQTVQNAEMPSPTVGFRVFMEVIEE